MGFSLLLLFSCCCRCCCFYFCCCRSYSCSCSCSCSCSWQWLLPRGQTLRSLLVLAFRPPFLDASSISCCCCYCRCRRCCRFCRCCCCPISDVRERMLTKSSQKQLRPT